MEQLAHSGEIEPREGLRFMWVGGRGLRCQDMEDGTWGELRAELEEGGANVVFARCSQVFGPRGKDRPNKTTSTEASSPVSEEI